MNQIQEPGTKTKDQRLSDQKTRRPEDCLINHNNHNSAKKSPNPPAVGQVTKSSNHQTRLPSGRSANQKITK